MNEPDKLVSPPCCRIVMPSGENARQEFLCYGAQREYVAGHNKLLSIHCVPERTLPAPHVGDPTKARKHPKGHKNA